MANNNRYRFKDLTELLGDFLATDLIVVERLVSGEPILYYATIQSLIDLILMTAAAVATPQWEQDGPLLRLTCATPEALVYFTIDGTVPDETSSPYLGEFVWDPGITYKAKGFKSGQTPSQIATISPS